MNPDPNQKKSSCDTISCHSFMIFASIKTKIKHRKYALGLSDTTKWRYCCCILIWYVIDHFIRDWTVFFYRIVCNVPIFIQILKNEGMNCWSVNYFFVAWSFLIKVALFLYLLNKVRNQNALYTRFLSDIDHILLHQNLHQIMGRRF